MKIVVRGAPVPKYRWMNRYWKSNGCNSVVYLEENDVSSVLDYWDDQIDGEGVNLECPVCRKAEYYYPTRSPVSAEDYYNK